MKRLLLSLAWLLAACTCLAADRQETKLAGDPRNIRTGHLIPDEGYCDQPYTVITKDGNWLCTLTTGRRALLAGARRKEGDRGQHIVATISADRGRTWSKPVDVERCDGPEASWVMPLVTPRGRVYAFYTYNAQDVRTWQGKRIRADTLGWYVYKYSDDHGRTWSPQRYRLPLREAAVDRGNTFGGKWQIFWGIGKPIVVGHTAYFAFSRCGKHLIDNSEGWFFRSDNVLSEPDAAKVQWQLLPEGDVGLRAPEFGHVQAEHNIVSLDDGSLYCMYRTVTGYPCHAYSRDGGRSWTEPEHARHAPGGRRMKNPRACPRIWRVANGKFLFWYHNHSGTSWRPRNPVWLAGGIERGGQIHWSQPEILLYDPDREKGMSYPDLIEQDGRYWITETQKTEARVHPIDPTLLEGLWSQGNVKTVAADGLVTSFQATGQPTTRIDMPRLADLSAGGGFSVDFWVTLADPAAGQVILDGRAADGKGIALTTADNGAIRIELSDGQETAAWDCDPGLLTSARGHHVAVIVDGGPKVISFVIDGRLCDGGTARQFGWGRFADGLGDVNGSGAARIPRSSAGKPGLQRLRIYNRSLRISEAVANYHAGPGD